MDMVQLTQEMLGFESESVEEKKLQESKKNSSYSDSLVGISFYMRGSFPMVSKL